MNPTLKALDKLQVEPYHNSKIRCGDIITFTSPLNGTYKITHRVISISPDGIKTGGDNNDDIDPWTLNPEDILGQVRLIRRGNRQLDLHGGLRGQLSGNTIRIFRMIKLKMFSMLYPFYNYLSKRGIFRQSWLLNRMKIKLISFKKGKDIELQLVLGKYVIGRKLPQMRWRIHYPFKLFINETHLAVTPPFHPINDRHIEPSSPSAGHE